MSIKWFEAGQEAVAVIAVGQVATGVIAIGQGATGIVAIGQLARGVFVVGQLAYGVVVIGQLGLSLGLVGGMVGVGAKQWFGWTFGVWPKRRPFPEASQPWTWWRLLILALLAVGFWFVVAMPVYEGLFGLGGAFNQPLR